MSEQRLGVGRTRPSPTRTAFQQDADLVVFSAAFRRLQDKTQVHPLSENDHVRTRLTHSIEVASVGRSLGTLAGQCLREDGALDADEAHGLAHAVFAACLAHDIGNPPFGHGGEQAIRDWFVQHAATVLAPLSEAQAADLCRFEGNAQGLRNLTRLENYRDAGGLRLTYATLGAFMKYTVAARDARADAAQVQRRKPGFHGSEEPYVRELRDALGLPEAARHPLAYFTEAADDICYAVVDVEDGMGLGLIRYEDAVEALCAVSGALPDLRLSKRERVQKLRGVAIGRLVHAVGDVFRDLQGALRDGKPCSPLLEQVPQAASVERCKRLAREQLFDAPEVAAQQEQGRRALHGLLDWFVPVATELANCGHERSALPAWAQQRAAQIGESYRPGDAYAALLGVVDHIAGMTDRYAVRLHAEVAGD